MILRLIVSNVPCVCADLISLSVPSLCPLVCCKESAQCRILPIQSAPSIDLPYSFMAFDFVLEEFVFFRDG